MKDLKENKDELTIIRVFDAPRELVWEAWTEPEHVKLWWGPKGFTSPVSKADLRVGGKYLNCMRSPDGKDYWSTGVYREILEPERLVLTDSFADPAGNVVPATYYGMGADLPTEMLITVTFEEEAGKTKMVLRHEGFPPGEMAEMTKQGWNESFDKLAKSLKKLRREGGTSKTRFTAEAGKPEVTATRVFDAPRELVFAASIDPELIPLWWGPRIFKTTVEKMDVRPGGTWRFIQRDPEGNEYAFNGEYHEVVPPERLVQTFEFEGMPGRISLETATVEEIGGKTRLTEKAVFGSAEERDGALSSGMESGWAESYDRLAELLKKEKTPIKKDVRKAVKPKQRRSMAR